MADTTPPQNTHQRPEEGPDRAQEIATMICETIYTTIARRDPHSEVEHPTIDPFEEIYYNGPNILPFLIGSMSTVIRGVQVVSNVGKAILGKTFGGAKRTVVEFFNRQRREYGEIKNELEQAAKPPPRAGKEQENAQSSIDRQLNTSRQRWREQPVPEIEQMPRALHAQRDDSRRIHKDGRRPLTELRQPRTLWSPSENRRAPQRRAKQLAQIGAVPAHLPRPRPPQPQRVVTPPEERARRQREQSWKMLSAETKKMLEDGVPLWKSPLEEEEEAAEKLRQERARRPRTLYEEPPPFVVPPISLPQRVYVKPSDESDVSSEEDLRTLRKFGKREKEVPWWMKPEPLGRPISSTKMWKKWFKPPPAGPSLNPINSKWRKRVDDAMVAPDRTVIAKTLKGDSLQRHDLFTCFRQLQWLNDEVINAYLALIVDYANKRQEGGDADSAAAKKTGTPKYHAFNSFFFTNLRDRGYDSVARWARRAKIGGDALLSVDTVFVPVHNHMHWTLILIRPQARTIEHFDSLGGPSPHHIQCVQKWLAGELRDKYKPEEWKVLPSVSPQQNNSSDCGVFLLTNAKMKMLEKELDFGPNEIPEIRRRIVAELIHGSLDGDFEGDEDEQDDDDDDDDDDRVI
ncbi:hypothetical protein KEM56_005215 [Ascosphaera pollenicola]|nr:hypothetical protein KEM56_005215 [Ascosphaera pollenicola]